MTTPSILVIVVTAFAESVSSPVNCPSLTVRVGLLSLQWQRGKNLTIIENGKLLPQVVVRKSPFTDTDLACLRLLHK